MSTQKCKSGFHGFSATFCPTATKQRSFVQYLAIQPWAFHKWLEIFQRVSPLFLRKVLETCLKNNQKLLFVTKVAQKLFDKAFFVQFWGVKCVAKQLWLELKPKKIVERTSSPETFKSCRVWIFVHHFEFSLTTTCLAAQLLLSCAHDLLKGEVLAPFFYRKFINCLLKRCEI